MITGHRPVMCLWLSDQLSLSLYFCIRPRPTISINRGSIYRTESDITISLSQFHDEISKNITISRSNW